MDTRRITILLIGLVSLILILPYRTMAIEISILNDDGITIYYDIPVDGSGNCTVLPSPSGYSGTVNIPETINHDGKKYTVNSIGEKAFIYCSDLIKVTLPSTIEKISSNAFDRCTISEGIILPDGLKEIQDYAFECSTISNGLNTLPKNLEYIGKCAFRYCYLGTDTLRLPEKLKYIDDRAFVSCGLKDIEFNENIEVIGEYTFSYNDIEYLITPVSIVRVGLNAFSNCSKLREVTINNDSGFNKTTFKSCDKLYKLTIKGEYYGHFYGKNYLGETKINTLVLGMGVKNISKEKFTDTNSIHGYCNTITKVIVLDPDNNQDYGVETIPLLYDRRIVYRARKGTDKIKTENDKPKTQIETRFLEHLNSMFDYNGITYAPVSTTDRTCIALFANIDSQENLEIGEKAKFRNIELDVVGCGPFFINPQSSIETLKYNINSDIPYMFAHNSKIKHLEINADIDKIGYCAFARCEEMSDITINGKVECIGERAFVDNAVKSINLPEGLVEIGGSAFNSCRILEQISFPSTLKKIFNGAFSNTKIRSWYIPSNVDYLGESSFESVDIDKIVIEDGDNELICGGQICGFSVNNLIIGRNIKKIEKWSSLANARNVVFTDCVTNIDEYLFKNTFYLETLNVGNGVKNIGNASFYECRDLKKVFLGKDLESIEYSAFENCVNLSGIYVAATLPPTCSSKVFDGVNKWDCTLYVPENAVASYSSTTPWNEFFFIEPYDFTNGIESIMADDIFDGHYRVYNLNGAMMMDTTELSDIKTLPVGIYIINGKKIIIK